ncbi:ABC transporter ATP-binding protein [Microbacterium sp. SL62]|uniref:ABC transporter ATP-binding protein n=1 Tax=Microbacterium sp. SL62 TaxID=2995139 RepID=UPI0022741272|nr:ABC transporter ATP-binding protein [Microbacterium sp. SL62]MCY1716445.1 ABC transporter ATP-binding protein [Microbacterium sp. SL62]
MGSAGHRQQGREIIRTVLGEPFSVLLVSLTLGAVVAGAWVVQPQLLGGLLAAPGSITDTWGTVAALLLITFAQVAVLTFQQLHVERVTIRGLDRLRRRLIDHVVRLPLEDVVRAQPGELASRVAADTSAVRTMVVDGMLIPVSSLLLVVGSFAMMATVSPLLASVALASIAVALSATWLIARPLDSFGVRVQAAVARLTSDTTSYLQAARTVKSGRLEDEAVRRLGAGVAEITFARARASVRLAMLAPVVTLGNQLSLVAVTGAAAALMAAGTLTAAAFFVFVIYFYFMVGPLQQLGSAFGALAQGSGALRRVAETLALLPESSAGAPVTRTATRRAQTEAMSALRIRGLSYSTGGGARELLRDLDLEVAPGERVGIVGPSGSGKSTLLDLVVRLREPRTGTIWVYGDDVRGMSLSRLRTRVHLVEQASPLLPGSVGTNVGLEQERLTARAGRVLAGLAGRMNADARSGSLSGGERQRLAWVRALSSDADIILFDEPTSALDGAAARALIAELSSLPPATAVVFVTHAPEMLRDFDRIYVLGEGRMVAHGTHEQLMTGFDPYRELVSVR